MSSRARPFSFLIGSLRGPLPSVLYEHSRSRPATRALLLSIAVCSLLACTEQVSVGSRDASAPHDGAAGRARTDECGNGIDDDRNGEIDDGCFCGAGDVQPCFSGDYPGRHVGVCRDGVQRCELAAGIEFGDWGRFACTGETLPATEACNGADDDCDGATDESCPCDEGQTRGCGTEFITAPCTPGAQSCRGGVWSACEGAIGPSADVCEDAIDNDCDGIVNEGCTCRSEPERCADGVDNDCDGMTDELRCASDGGVPIDGGVPLECDAPLDRCAAPETAVTVVAPDLWTSITHGVNFAEPFAIASSGSEVAIAMYLSRRTLTVDDAIHLLRFAPDGTFIGDSRPIVGLYPGERGGGFPNVSVVTDLLWSGSSYLVLWDGVAVDLHAYLARVSADGATSGARVEIDPGHGSYRALAAEVDGRLLVSWIRADDISSAGTVMAREFDLATLAPVGLPFEIGSGWRLSGSDVVAVGDVAAIPYFVGSGEVRTPHLAFVRGGAVIDDVALDVSPLGLGSDGVATAASGCRFLACWRTLLQAGITSTPEQADAFLHVDRCQLFDVDGARVGATFEPRGSRGGQSYMANVNATDVVAVPGGFVLRVSNTTAPGDGLGDRAPWFASIDFDGRVVSMVNLPEPPSLYEYGESIVAAGQMLTFSWEHTAEILDEDGNRRQTDGVAVRRVPLATCP